MYEVIIGRQNTSIGWGWNESRDKVRDMQHLCGMCNECIVGCVVTRGGGSAQNELFSESRCKLKFVLVFAIRATSHNARACMLRGVGTRNTCGKKRGLGICDVPFILNPQRG